MRAISRNLDFDEAVRISFPVKSAEGAPKTSLGCAWKWPPKCGHADEFEICLSQAEGSI